MTDVTLRVFDADLATEVGVLDQPYGIGWVESRLDLGGGEFAIPHDSPAVTATPDLLKRGNVVKVEVDGTAVFAWEVERRNRTRGATWDPIQVTGPGALNLLDHARVYLQSEQELLQQRQRVFGWMSLDYDASGWIVPPYTGGTQDNPVVTARIGHPEGWEQIDPAAEWVWSAAPDGAGDHPVGNSYFRLTMDTNAEPAKVGPARLHITADNNFVAYLDGQKVAEGADWRGIAEVDFTLQPNTVHVIAVEVRNRGGPAGLLASVKALLDDPDEQFELGGTLWNSQPAAPWLTLHNPSEPPGVTHGFVLETLFTEAQARGRLQGITIDFDKDVDSDGVPWADEVEVTAQVGNDSVLDVANRMRDWPVEFRMTPDFTFQAFSTMGTDKTASVTLPLDLARELDWESEDDVYDVLLVQTEFAWDEVPDPLPVNGRREGFLSLAQSPTLGHALRTAERVRQTWATPRERVTFATSTLLAVPQPYTSYEVGDVVQGPALPDVAAADWVLDDLRVDTISGQIDLTGELTWVHESVVAQLRSSVERLLTSRQALGDGTLDGRTQVSTPPVGEGGRGVATTQRKGGSGADPRTITVESTDVVVPGGEAAEAWTFRLPWQQVTSILTEQRFDVETFPTDDLTIPATAVWRPRIELEWDEDGLVPSWEDENGWRGGGQVLLRVNGIVRWPAGAGDTLPVIEGYTPLFAGTLPDLVLRLGDAVSVSLDHATAEDRTLSRALLTLTLVEPVAELEEPANPIPSTGTNDCTVTGPTAWVRTYGAESGVTPDPENMLADSGCIYDWEGSTVESTSDAPLGSAALFAGATSAFYNTAPPGAVPREAIDGRTILVRMKLGGVGGGIAVCRNPPPGAAAGETPGPSLVKIDSQTMQLHIRESFGVFAPFDSWNFSMAAGRWYTIIASMDPASGLVRVWRDGTLVVEDIASVAIPVIGDPLIGASRDVFGAPAVRLSNAAIQEVLFWNEPLTPPEVLPIFDWLGTY